MKGKDTFEVLITKCSPPARHQWYKELVGKRVLAQWINNSPGAVKIIGEPSGPVLKEDCHVIDNEQYVAEAKLHGLELEEWEPTDKIWQPFKLSSSEEWNKIAMESCILRIKPPKGYEKFLEHAKEIGKAATDVMQAHIGRYAEPCPLSRLLQETGVYVSSETDPLIDKDRIKWKTFDEASKENPIPESPLVDGLRSLVGFMTEYLKKTGQFDQVMAEFNGNSSKKGLKTGAETAFFDLEVSEHLSELSASIREYVDKNGASKGNSSGKTPKSDKNVQNKQIETGEKFPVLITAGPYVGERGMVTGVFADSNFYTVDIGQEDHVEILEKHLVAIEPKGKVREYCEFAKRPMQVWSDVFKKWFTCSTVSGAMLSDSRICRPLPEGEYPQEYYDQVAEAYAEQKIKKESEVHEVPIPEDKPVKGSSLLRRLVGRVLIEKSTGDPMVALWYKSDIDVLWVHYGFLTEKQVRERFTCEGFMF